MVTHTTHISVRRYPDIFRRHETERPASLPSPSNRGISQMFDDLSQYVRSSSGDRKSGGQGGTGTSHGIENVCHSSSHERKVEYELDLPVNRTLFADSKKFAQIQRSLISVHNAKSFVYSSNFFGQKRFYNDEFDFKKTPLHPDDRRRIRFGLKSIVDFIIQLDLQHLKSYLVGADTGVQQFFTKMSSTIDIPYPDDSFFGLMAAANPTKSKRVIITFQRIISNLHFSQSMSEFLASEGSIETAKLVVSEALKRGPDLGRFLRGGSFASCAQVYRHLSSKFDYDAAIFLNQKSSPPLSRTRNTMYYRSSTQNRPAQKFPYPTGYCYQFQKYGSCSFPSCKFDHLCSHCKATTHGANNCPRLMQPGTDSVKDTHSGYRNTTTS